MQTIPDRRNALLRIAVALCPLIAFAANARADIFQWEYINPADPSLGKQQSTTLAPDGAGVDAVPGANLSGRNLTMAYLIGASLANASPFSGSNLVGTNLSRADLTNANLGGSNLTDADFTGANVREANFSKHVFRFIDGPDLLIGSGITSAQLATTTSYQAHDLSGIGLRYNDLSSANFAGQNLAHADFSYATLTSTNFAGADVRGANFETGYRGGAYPGEIFGTGIPLDQLYCTASYQAHNLTGIGLGGNLGVSGGDFAGQNLTNANFAYANWTGADFTAADTRGSDYFLNGYYVGPYPAGAITVNLIQVDGHISGLGLDAGSSLVVRNYRNRLGDPTPFPITVDQHLAMRPSGTLRMVFEADAWNSTISFAPGIPVTLGGTLALTFADDVDLTSQLGRTLDLFDWTGVNPSGSFAVASQYKWDISKLYTTGEVTLVNLLLPGDLNDDGRVDVADISAMMGALADLDGYELSHGLSATDLLVVADLNGDNQVTSADIQGLINLLANSDTVAIPEPPSFALAAIGVLGLIISRRPSSRRSPIKAGRPCRCRTFNGLRHVRRLVPGRTSRGSNQWADRTPNFRELNRCLPTSCQ